MTRPTPEEITKTSLQQQEKKGKKAPRCSSVIKIDPYIVVVQLATRKINNNPQRTPNAPPTISTPTV
jgi:hypothetical protein